MQQASSETKAKAAGGGGGESKKSEVRKIKLSEWVSLVLHSAASSAASSARSPAPTIALGFDVTSAPESVALSTSRSVAVLVSTVQDADTSAARPEVQIVRTSQASMMPEVRRLTVSASHVVLEMQRIYVTRDDSELRGTSALTYGAHTSIGNGPSVVRESTLGGGGASAGQRWLAGGAAVVGVLCLALVRRRRKAATGALAGNIGRRARAVHVARASLAKRSERRKATSMRTAAAHRARVAATLAVILVARHGVVAFQDRAHVDSRHRVEVDPKHRASSSRNSERAPVDTVVCDA